VVNVVNKENGVRYICTKQMNVKPCYPRTADMIPIYLVLQGIMLVNARKNIIGQKDSSSEA